MPHVEQARITIVAEFPEGYFLENLAIRHDGSTLVTAMNKKELWLVPAPQGPEQVTPQLLHTFRMMTMFIVEIDPDIFVVAAADVYESHEAELYQLDLRHWRDGQAVSPTCILQFPQPHVGLNGGCLIGPRVLLAAGAANLVWRVDLSDGDGQACARIWLEHDSMKNRPGEKKPEQPGINGIRYDSSAGYVYYTSTSQQLMLGVRVDPETLEPADLPMFIAGGREWDDFIIDEDAGVAYVTTHRENTIDRVRLEPDGNRQGRTVIAGDPFTDLLVGPSSGAWTRGKNADGLTAYFTTDGGTAQSPDGKQRSAKLICVQIPQFEAQEEALDVG